MTQRQKQVQNVKIVIGETKAKRRRAPQRRAPQRRPPPLGPPGGGAAGGAPPPPPPPSAGAPGFFPFPMMFPQRSGPIVESTSQLQQLVRPLEQSLRLLEQARQPPPAPPAPPAQPAQLPFDYRSVRDFVSRYIENYPIIEEEVPKRSIAVGGPDEVNPALGNWGQQYQIVAPDPALVRAVDPPLVDAVVQPDERGPEPPPAPPQPPQEEKRPDEMKAEIEYEEEEELPIPKRREEYTKPDILDLDRRGNLNEDFLKPFPVKKTGNKQRGLDLLDIGRTFGISFPTYAQSEPKENIIRFIMEKKDEFLRTGKKVKYTRPE